MSEGVGYIVRRIRLEDVRAAKPAKIYYGASTCWWTHDSDQLCVFEKENAIPRDPRGGVLLETDDADGFLQAAVEEEDHYGAHGLDAFIAAHHMNCRVGSDDDRSTCFESWDEYNDAIDRTFSYDLTAALATTRHLWETCVLDVDPRQSPAVIVDWGLRSDDHTQAMIRAISSGWVGIQELNHVFGNGPRITELVASCPAVGRKDLVFETAYDYQLVPEEEGEDDPD